MKPIDRNRAASEASLLLNESIRQLLIPQHLFALFSKLNESGRVPERYASAVRHVAITSAVVNLYRIKEAHDHLLIYLFSEDELRTLGFPRLDRFVGDWKSFEMVRHQYVGHAIARKTAGGQPGRVISAKALGKALRSTGLWDAETFLRRVREELVPSLQTIRDELFRRFPGARRFVEVIYPADVDEAAERAKMEGP